MQFKSMTIDGKQYHIKRLKSMGLLKRIGPDKGGYWQIMEDMQLVNKIIKKENFM